MSREEITVAVLPSTIDQIEAIQTEFEERQGERPSKNMVVEFAIDEFYDLTVRPDADWWA